jgi:hypothetical protein
VIGEYPSPPFAHLKRLSDDTGMLEHASGAIPSREHGYCVDDVARGLLVVSREPSPSAELVALAERYLAFVRHAQAGDGMFRNRLSYERTWLDAPDTGDWWGRAIWGLGTAAARGPSAAIRQGAWTGFERAIHCRSRWPRAMAFAGLGAAEVLSVTPDHPGARRLLADAVVTIGGPGRDPAWPWPEPRLAYANAALAEVHLAAGQYLDDPRASRNGLLMLGWLLEQETYDGHLSPTPVGGRAVDGPRPGFDQQPIEAAALADACARAAAITHDPQWTDGLRQSIDWFLGANDAKVELVDWDSGGCGDGLRADGRSDNQGAESTLAMVASLQHGRGLTMVHSGH